MSKKKRAKRDVKPAKKRRDKVPTRQHPAVGRYERRGQR